VIRPAAATEPSLVAEEITRAFAAGGALAAAVPGFVPRPSQADMAATVHRAILDGATLVAEAGTGTGKTFGYLVPALLAGGKLLISTGTKPLQDQLFRKDLPAVLKALKINAATALLKGRANYLCLHRMARAEGEALLSSRDDARHLRAIVRFAAVTVSGDRAELSEVPETAAVWPLVTSTRDNCLGAECPRFSGCFVFKARRDAQAADVVVVNHHLFLADLALRDDAIREFLPTVDTVILDEAHQVPDVAADFFGTTLSLAQWIELARDSRALGLSRAADGASWAPLAARIEKAVRDVRLTLGDIGLAPGSRTPLARLPSDATRTRLNSRVRWRSIAGVIRNSICSDRVLPNSNADSPNGAVPSERELTRTTKAESTRRRIPRCAGFRFRRTARSSTRRRSRPVVCSRGRARRSLRRGS
jgi:ATP-dependent DNA helicase DinG